MIKAIQCTSCGANINVDSSLSTVICEYCNTTFATANFLKTQADDVHTSASTELEPHTTALAEFEIRDGVLEKYNGNSENVIIPDGVTHIGDNAFRELVGIKSVTIPNGVLSLGKSSFSGCDHLESISIPETVKEIGHKPNMKDYFKFLGDGSVFRGCTSLSSVDISPDVWLSYQFSFTDTPFYKNNKNRCLCGGKLTWWDICKSCGAKPLFTNPLFI